MRFALPSSIVEWVVRIVLAAVVFFVVLWLLPLLGSAIQLNPPVVVIRLVALALALIVLFGTWTARVTSAT